MTLDYSYSQNISDKKQIWEGAQEEGGCERKDAITNTRACLSKANEERAGLAN